MKELDQRNKNKLHIDCNCGFNGHSLEFIYYVDDYNLKNETGEKIKNKSKMWKHYYINLISPSEKSFIERLKISFKYIFYRNYDLYYHDIGITSKDIKKIIKHFEKYNKLC